MRIGLVINDDVVKSWYFKDYPIEYDSMGLLRHQMTNENRIEQCKEFISKYRYHRLQEVILNGKEGIDYHWVEIHQSSMKTTTLSLEFEKKAASIRLNSYLINKNLSKVKLSNL